MIHHHIDFDDARPATTPQPPCPAASPTSQVMSVMRLCGPELGLSTQVLRTLEVLLSCLAPKRNHHMVFASNETLVARASGLSERSIRRHIAQLVALDLVERRFSANGKRYSRHDPVAGMTQRFGLDFTKLFAQFATLSARAVELEKLNSQLRYLRSKLRAACQKILCLDPEHKMALEARNAARRNISAVELDTFLGALSSMTEQNEAVVQAPNLTATAGQNDRHQSNISKELIDKKEAEDIGALLNHCSEAQSFAPTTITNEADMLRHAKTLAPMIGISPSLWAQAAMKRSSIDLAASIWLIIQNLDKIKQPAAYFTAIMIGVRAASFSPWAWLERQVGSNCPRTIT